MDKFSRVSEEGDYDKSPEERLDTFNKQRSKKNKREPLITITADSRNEAITNLNRVEFARDVSPTDYTMIRAGMLEGTTRAMLEKIKKRRTIMAPSKSNSQTGQ